MKRKSDCSITNFFKRTSTTLLSTSACAISTISGTETETTETVATANACENANEASSSTTLNTVTVAKGKEVKNRKYNQSWEAKFKWLSYSSAKDCVFCDDCKKAGEMNLLTFSTKAETKFTVNGFCNWKKALEKFKKHEESHCHREAQLKVAATKAGVHIRSALSAAELQQRQENKRSLVAVIDTLRFLARQGLPVRSHVESESNFLQLLQLRSKDCSVIKKWLLRPNFKWLSHDIQNEILELMANDVTKKLIQKIKIAKYFGIMADETRDISGQEQVSICLRFSNEVIDKFTSEEMFVGFYSTSNTTADMIFTILSDVLLRFGLSWSNCRGQCYDGASNMAGRLNGVQTKVREVEQRALFVHCFAHNLNLVVQDAVKEEVLFRDSFSEIKSLVTFVRDSPKRIAQLAQLQSADSGTLRPLCPTRWTMRRSCLDSLLQNYTAIMNLLEEISAENKTEAGAKASGLQTTFNKFSTFFAVRELHDMFGVIETTNVALQAPSLTIRQASELISVCKQLLSSKREKFDWQGHVQKALELDIEEPQVPRTRRRPTRYEEGAPEHIFASAEDHFRRAHLAMYDAAIGAIDRRFPLDTLSILSDAEEIICQPNSNDKLKKVTEFYGDDIDSNSLLEQAIQINDYASSKQIELNCLSDVRQLLCDNTALAALVPHVVTLMKILITVPATSCTAERSFSALKRIKTMLRSTMLQERLNAVTMLHVHKELTDAISVEDIANEFLQANVQRHNAFAV